MSISIKILITVLILAAIVVTVLFFTGVLGKKSNSKSSDEQDTKEPEEPVIIVEPQEPVIIVEPEEPVIIVEPQEPVITPIEPPSLNLTRVRISRSSPYVIPPVTGVVDVSFDGAKVWSFSSALSREFYVSSNTVITIEIITDSVTFDSFTITGANPIFITDTYQTKKFTLEPTGDFVSINFTLPDSLP